MAEKAQKTLTIEIDGRSIEAKPGQMLIQVADDSGIYIPRFCYHKKLSIAANCRMCLVDVEGARKPTPACATPIMDGMKVFTKSQKTIAYQKSIMEFLLINHPLDCPICDQGGECELQDVAMGYGNDVSHFAEAKRVVPNPDLGSLVSTDMTRCIQCTRCVRFGEEIAGVRELGMIDRGDSAKISTYVEKALNSEISGNIIDICPVGALTSKPFRYRARAWELQQKDTISPHDGLGSSMHVHVRQNDVMRVVPKENESLNEVWLSDRDRFSYQGLHAEDRLASPIIKKNGDWVEVSWEEAIDFVKVAVQMVSKNSGAEKIGALASESSTVEELYLLQKLIRGIGSNNIDSRLKQVDFSQNASAGAGIDCSPAEIEASDCILLLGSHLQKEHPLLNLRVKKAADGGAKVVVINSFASHSNYKADEHVFETAELIHVLAAIVKGIRQRVSVELPYNAELAKLLDAVSVNAEIEHMVRSLLDAERPVFLLGSKIVMHKDFSTFNVLFKILQALLPMRGGVLSFGANARGTEIIGAVPYHGAKGKKLVKNGENVDTMLSGDAALELIFLLNNEPEVDTQYGETAISTLKNMDIVVALSPFAGKAMLEYADIILPINTFVENSGTYVNFNGVHQSFKPAAKAFGEAKTAWKILRVIANYLELEGYNYASTEDILLEIDNLEKHKVSVDIALLLPKILPTSQEALQAEPQISLYAVDNIVRRAPALNATRDHYESRSVAISDVLAEQLGIESGDEILLQTTQGDIQLPVFVRAGLAAKTILLPVGLSVEARSVVVQLSKMADEVMN
jgi:NADH-quinone oxidoreductase subunit G